MLREQKFDIRTENDFNKTVEYLRSVNEPVSMKKNDMGFYTLMFFEGIWCGFYRTPEVKVDEYLNSLK